MSPSAVRAALLAALLAAASSPTLDAQSASEPQPASILPAADLAALFAIDDPEARAERADELAGPFDYDALRDLVRAWRPVEPLEPGTRPVEVELWNGRGTERTELWVHVPRELAGGDDGCPLILYGHGTGGTGQHGVSMWRGVADRIGAVVVAPSESGPNDGYRYAERERQIALSALRWVQQHVHSDADRLFVTGVSRGGHLSWDLITRYPDRFAGAAPMIGGPRINPAEGQNNVRYLENVVPISIRDLQGSRDDPRLLKNLRLAFARLEELGADDAVFREFPDMGHSFRFDAVDWVEWIDTTRRTAMPRTVIRRAARKGEGRAFWLEVAQTDREVQDEVKLKVRAEEWNQLDDGGQRRFLADYVDERTARLTGEQSERGRFRLDAARVRKARVWLTPEMLDADGEVLIEIGRRRVKKKPKMHADVLLREFAERLDRSFLPGAVVEVRP